MTVSENMPVALAPVESVTVTLNVAVPLTLGAPRSRPEERSVSPAGAWPDHVYGGTPPPALKVVVKKLLTNTFWPAPTSQTPFAHVKKRESIARGGVWPVPAPALGARCGVWGAVSGGGKGPGRGPGGRGGEGVGKAPGAPPGGGR